MVTRIIKAENAADAGEIIKRGGLVAFPTETVYGLGADAMNGDAVLKIFAAKGRPSDNPLIAHIADKRMINEIAAEVNDNAKRLIEAFMPGPITIIMKKRPSIPNEVTAGLDTVGIRFPSDKTAQAFIRAAGTPIAAPSANLSGSPSPTRAEDVISDMDGRIDAIISGGSCEVGVESTIVDASGKIPVLLRPGGVTPQMLREVVPELEIDKNILNTVGENEQPRCPGTKYRHYAPKAKMIVVEGDCDGVQAKVRELLEENRGKIVGVLTMYGNIYDEPVMISGGADNKEYAKNYFSALRDFDKLGAELIIAEFCERDGYGLAVRNRLYKSAGYNVVHV